MINKSQYRRREKRSSLIAPARSQTFERLSGLVERLLEIDYRELAKNGFQVFSVYTSIGFIHFFSYLVFFDHEIIGILDFSAISSFFWGVSLLIVASLGLGRLTTFLFFNYFGHTIIALRTIEFARMLILERYEIRYSIRKLSFVDRDRNRVKLDLSDLEKEKIIGFSRSREQKLDRLESIFFYTNSLVIFSLIYVGGVNTIDFAVKILIVFVILLSIYSLRGSIIRMLEFLPLTKGSRPDSNFWLSGVIQNGTRASLALLLTFGSFFLGVERAEWTQRTSMFDIYEAEHKIFEDRPIILRSQSGVVVFDPSDQSSHYLSWERGIKLVRTSPPDSGSFKQLVRQLSLFPTGTR
ncbi:MAG: hypothetical protein ACMVY4_03625 [Minwuia sp.]|uniref:hypothetical protein n=1 Tax=Minwuia sp. TaxID=2493630 RepID=UPI003A8580AC